MAITYPDFDKSGVTEVEDVFNTPLD